MFMMVLLMCMKVNKNFSNNRHYYTSSHSITQILNINLFKINAEGGTEITHKFGGNY